MKKIFLAFAVAGVMFLSGCNVIEGVLSGDLAGSLLNTPTVDVYEELASLAASPSRKTDVSAVKFVAEVASDPFVVSIDEEEFTYQQVYISRAYDDPIFVNVSGIENPPEAGTYAVITGRLDGSIYWTENNKREEVPDILASGIEAFEVSDAEPDTSNTMSFAQGSYMGNLEFVGAHYAENAFGRVIVAYINFTNTAPESNVKLNGLGYMLGRFDVYHGEAIAKGSSAFAPDDLDPGALKAGDLQAYTPSGKTQLYYTMFEVDENADEDVLHFALFDDEFAFAHLVKLPIAEDLASMQ